MIDCPSRIPRIGKRNCPCAGEVTGARGTGYVAEHAPKDLGRRPGAHRLLEPNQAGDVVRPSPHHESPRDQVAVYILTDASVALPLLDKNREVLNEHELSLGQLVRHAFCATARDELKPGPREGIEFGSPKGACCLPMSIRCS